MSGTVCRVCLGGNIRMQSVGNLHLLEIYEKLTNTKLDSETGGMPSTVCYICHRLLQRCHRFSHTARKSNRILQSLLHTSAEITHSTVSKQSPQLHQLSVTSTRSFLTMVHEDSIQPVKQEQVVKEEADDRDYVEIDIVEVKTEPEDVETDVNTEQSVEEEDVKNEQHVLCACCDLCNKEITAKDKLAGHVKFHIEKPFTCNVCDKTFRQKSALTEHMVVHTGEKPFNCNICEKAFSHKSNLTTHMRIHSGERPYACFWCDKTFNHNSNLKTHMRVHTAEKPFSCNICDKTFIQKGHLARHMRVHSAERPFSCVVCHKAFSQGGNLAIHMGIHKEKHKAEVEKAESVLQDQCSVQGLV